MESSTYADKMCAWAWAWAATSVCICPGVNRETLWRLLRAEWTQRASQGDCTAPACSRQSPMKRDVMGQAETCIERNILENARLQRLPA